MPRRGKSENITDGLGQRRRGSREASLDGKNRDEPTGIVDDANPDVEIGMSGQLLSTIVTSHLQRQVLAGPPTPRPVVRRQEKLATPLKSFNMRNWPSGAR